MELPLPAAGCPPRRPSPSPPPPAGDAPGGSGGAAAAGVSTAGRPPPPPSTSLWPLSVDTPPPPPPPTPAGQPPPGPRRRWWLFGLRPPSAASAATGRPPPRYGRRPHAVWVACLAALSAVAVVNSAILLHHAAIRCYHPVTATLVHVAGPEPRRMGVAPAAPTYGDPRYFVRVRDLRGRAPEVEVDVPRYAPSVRYGRNGWTRRRRGGRSATMPDAEFYDALRGGINAPLVVYMSRAKGEPVLEPPGGYGWRRAVGWVTAGLAAAAAGAAVALAVADCKAGGGAATAAAAARHGGSFPAWWSSSGRGGGGAPAAEEDIVWMGDWVAWADAADGGRDGGRSTDGGTSRAGPTRPPRLAGADHGGNDPGGGSGRRGEPRSGGGRRRSSAGLAAVEIEGVLAAGAVRPAAFGATAAAVDWSCAICLDGLPAGATAAATSDRFPGDGGGDGPPADDAAGGTLAAVRSWVAAARRGSVASVPFDADSGGAGRGAKGAAAARRRPPDGGLATGADDDDDCHGAPAGGGAAGARLPRRLVCLPCTHVFHARCLRRWLVLGSTACPLCKRYVHRRKGRAAAGGG